MPLPPCPYCGHEHADTVLKCPKTDMVLSLKGRLLEEKFRMVRRLGKGGMASVWLALNTRVDREVAIKLIRPEVLKNDELVARFRSEAKAAGRIDHPNVCAILDFGIGPVGPYIVMEYLRGHTLSQMIKRSGPMEVPMAASLVRQALVGLAAAHREGIVHRDLKPENVFLHETPGGKLVVKIMDFGVAKFTDGSSEITTEQGALLGTPEYMAPEQFLGADMAEPRTDIWAVGAILYRALTGKHAFKGPTVAATLMLVTNEEPTPIRELAPEVPEELAEIVARCLAKDPKDRFRNATELRDALAPFELDEDPAHPGTSSLRMLLDRVNEVDPELPSPAVPLPDPELGAPVPTSASQRSTEALQVSSRRSMMPWILLGAAVVIGGVWVARTLEDGAQDGQEQARTQRHEPQRKAESDPEPEHGAAPTNGVEPPEPAKVAPEPEPTPEPEPEPESGPQPEPEPTPEPEAASDTNEGGDPDAIPPDPPPDPISTDIVLVDKFVVAKTRGNRADHGDARKYCQALDMTNHAGIKGWKLPPPGAVRKLKEAEDLPHGQYWTSARWRNRVKVYGLPSGRITSQDADHKAARALCVAPAPKHLTESGAP